MDGSFGANTSLAAFSVPREWTASGPSVDRAWAERDHGPSVITEVADATAPCQLSRRWKTSAKFPPLEKAMKGEFMKFLKEYGVIGLAIGVIIGSKAGELVKSIVDGLLMPIVGLVLPSGDWQQLVVGPFQVGIVLAALINFVIVAFIVFVFAKKVLKEDSVSKK